MTKLLHLFLATLFCMTSLCASAQDSEVTTVLKADFTQFTEGSPSAPVEFPSYGTGTFTSFFPSWYVSKVSKAGGSILINDGGYVQTAGLNLSANSGVARITVRVKAMDAYGCAVKVSMGYSTSASATEYIYDNEWHDIEMILSGGLSSTRIKVEPYLSASGILVESLLVEQSASFFAAPKATQPSVAGKTSFTATWNSVSGTKAYYLDVYSYDAEGQKEYFLKNENCGTSRSKKVEGLDASKTYYYVVRASNGQATSMDSNEIEVVPVISSIGVPVVADATVANGKASFTWNPVEDAHSYIVTIYKHTTLADAQNIDIINDDFAKVTEGSFSSIEFTYARYLDLYTNVKGWDGAELALASGNIVLTPFSGATGSLTTPELDLSADGGNFSVTYNLAEGAYGYFFSGSTATVNLLDSEDNVLETKNITLKKEYNDYTLTFTKGAANCRVQITYAGTNKLFINNVTLSQLLAAGSIIDEVVSEEDVNDTSYSFDYTPADNVSMGYTVIAVGKTVVSGEITNLYSDASDEKFVTASAAIGSVDTDSTDAISIVVIAPGQIEITVDQPYRATIFDLNGRAIASANLAAGANTIDCAASGIVIVSVANKAVKVVL